MRSPFALLRGAFDDYCDRKRDAWDWGSGAKARWWIARQVDRLPGQCWSDLADYGLGKTVIPWAPRRPLCSEDAARIGSCYCGKVARADVAAMPNGPRCRVVLAEDRA